MACCWLVILDHEWNWCIGAAFIEAIFGPQMVNHLHFAALYVLSDFSFHKLSHITKFHCDCRTTSRRLWLSMGLTICWIFLGICLWFFDFLSQCCRGPHSFGPMYHCAFLQHCIWFVDPYLCRRYGSPNDRCFFCEMSLHFRCTWHSGRVFHVCSFELGYDLKWWRWLESETGFLSG